VGHEGGGRLPSSIWWMRQSPLAADCTIALDILGCTPSEYYQRTTWKERALIRLHLAYRQEQTQAADEHQQQHAAAQAEADRMAQRVQGRTRGIG